jgi:hypothetical protein
MIFASSRMLWPEVVKRDEEQPISKKERTLRYWRGGDEWHKKRDSCGELQISDLEQMRQEIPTI